MSGPGVPEDDMHFRWQPKADVPPFGDAALDAVLAPGQAPDHADGALRPVAEVLAALRTPPSRNELAGLDRALAEFRTADRGRTTAPRRHGPARPAYRRARLFAQLGAAAIISLLGVFGGAGYAGALPGALQGFAHRVIAAPAPARPAARTSHGPGSGHSRPAAEQATSGPGSSPPPGHRAGRFRPHPPGGPAGHHHPRHHVPKSKGPKLKKTPKPGGRVSMAPLKRPGRLDGAIDTL
jgi:hypothetical protein